MKSKTLRSGIFAGLAAVAVTSSVQAELPALEVKPWYGYFAGTQGKHADIGLDTDGHAVIIPLGKDRKQMTTQFYIPVLMQVEEVLPDGKTSVKKFDVDSIESTSPATVKPGAIVFKGKIQGGDTTFEGYFDSVRGMVLVGGRIVEKGSITNPLKFTVKLNVPTAYKNAKDTTSKEFKKKIEADKFELKLLDGKKKKATGADAFDPASAEFGGGIGTQAEFNISEFGENVFSLTASPGSKLSVTNTKSSPFYNGLSISWEADAGGDQSKARLAIDVK